MNVARKILAKMKTYLMFRNVMAEGEEFPTFVRQFEEWIEWHEKMFDHSKYNYFRSEDEREKLVKGWLAFHDKILKE